MSDLDLSFCLQATSPVPLDITLTCKAGQITVLAGASGSGKTTLLRSLAGLHRVQSGLIRIGPFNCFDSQQKIDLSPQQRPIGLVFQHHALFPHLNARDNVKIALQHLPRAMRQSKALEWLKRVRLETHALAHPATLSGGERQRLALARALAREPAALLLDEPFAAIDKNLRQDLYRELAELRDQLNLAILWVTHDLDEAFTVADSLALIDQGRLLQAGPPQQVRQFPADLKVARQLGQVNLMQGELKNGTLYWQGHCLGTPNIFHQNDTLQKSNGKTCWSIQPQQIRLYNDTNTAAADSPRLAARLLRCVRLGQSWHLELALGNQQLKAITTDFWPLGKVWIELPTSAIQLIPGS